MNVDLPISSDGSVVFKKCALPIASKPDVFVMDAENAQASGCLVPLIQSSVTGMHTIGKPFIATVSVRKDITKSILSSVARQHRAIANYAKLDQIGSLELKNMPFGSESNTQQVEDRRLRSGFVVSSFTDGNKRKIDTKNDVETEAQPSHSSHKKSRKLARTAAGGEDAGAAATVTAAASMPAATSSSVTGEEKKSRKKKTSHASSSSS